MVILTLTTNNSEYGNVTGAGTYDAGTSVTITATANNGYTFIAWTDNNGIVVSGLENYTTIINEDTTLQAVFMNNVGVPDVYGMCSANCRHKVLNASQTMYLVQQMLANGGEIPADMKLTTPVTEIIDQNTGLPLKLWTGTTKQWSNWKGNKENIFALMTDDQSYTSITNRIKALEIAVAELKTLIK